jgi:hypothetical protein
VSLECYKGKWFIVYRPRGRYGQKIRLRVPDGCDPQKVHDKFIAAWKASPPSRKTPDPGPTEKQKRRLREKKNPGIVISRRISILITGSLKKKRQERCRQWEMVVGYNIEDLKEHLERQFLPGMSWENIGKWHIDHKVPIAAFNYKTIDDIDFKRCWALENLRPMWALENMKKGARVDFPFQPSLNITI